MTTTKKKPVKNSDAAYGAESRGNILLFDPEKLKIVDDPKSELYEDPDGLVPTDAFVASVAFHGILEPVLIRKNTETGESEVVAGRKRVLAARLANKMKVKRGEKPILVPAIVRRGEPLSVMAVMAAENEGRVEKTPMQRAKLMQSMMDRGATEADLAIHFSCSIVTVKNLLGLQEAPAVVRKAIDAGDITVTAGYKLSKLSATEAKERLAEALSKAPQVKGRKKAKGRAAMEIITRTRSLRKKSEIEEMVTSVEVNARSSGQTKALVGILRWVLGEDDTSEFLVEFSKQKGDDIGGEDEEDDGDIEEEKDESFVPSDVEGAGGPAETLFDHSPKGKSE